MTNAEIIRRLRREAQSLARRGENLYRVRAYRQAAFRLANLPGEVANLGPEALRAVGIGKSLAKAVYEWSQNAVERTDIAKS
jgi:DNA polymerase/3'-5' exonuclease PolX